MERVLSDLITQYVDVAARFFPRVAAHLDVVTPIKNMDWAMLGAARRGETPDGLKYLRHGFGVRMSDDSIGIDLDLGDAGQIDGFDAWRLFDFAKQNDIVIPYKDESALDAELRRLAKQGDLRRRGKLYYRENEI